MRLRASFASILPPLAARKARRISPRSPGGLRPGPSQGGRSHARGPKARLGGCACGRAGSLVVARGRACPLAWNYRGDRDAAWLCNRQESDRAEVAGTPARLGGPEARLAASLRSSDSLA
ncbi:MAG: hypothetical protein ACYDHX_16285 [Methanothrix sp.]